MLSSPSSERSTLGEVAGHSCTDLPWKIAFYLALLSIAMVFLLRLMFAIATMETLLV